MILTLRTTIPSNSHNAPFTINRGYHWPEGSLFKLLPKCRQVSVCKLYRTAPNTTIVEQIGGEEVLVAVPNDRFEELFGISR